MDKLKVNKNLTKLSINSKVAVRLHLIFKLKATKMNTNSIPFELKEFLKDMGLEEVNVSTTLALGLPIAVTCKATNFDEAKKRLDELEEESDEDTPLSEECLALSLVMYHGAETFEQRVEACAHMPISFSETTKLFDILFDEANTPEKAGMLYDAAHERTEEEQRIAAKWDTLIINKSIQSTSLHHLFSIWIESRSDSHAGKIIMKKIFEAAKEAAKEITETKDTKKAAEYFNCTPIDSEAEKVIAEAWIGITTTKQEAKEALEKISAQNSINRHFVVKLIAAKFYNWEESVQ